MGVMVYEGYEVGEYDVDCLCGQGISNLQKRVVENLYDGEMHICEDCGRKLLLYGEGSTKTAIDPQNLLRADRSGGLTKLRPHRSNIDRLKLDTLSIIADYQTESGHWFWNKDIFDGWFLYSNGEYYIGFIYWYLSSKKPTLHSIFVEESQRREGYGREMMEKWMKKFGDCREFRIRDPNDKAKELVNSLEADFKAV